MNIGMIESLIGAGSSMKRASVSMNVYVQARNNGDEETMQRALGYTVDSAKQAEKYSEKLGEATKADQQQNSKEMETEQAEVLAKNKLENQIENQIKKEQLYHNDIAEKTDSVQWSEQAKQYMEQQVKLAVKQNVEIEKPNTYLSTGELQPTTDIDIPKLDIAI